jgi:hypothetical protein
MNQPLSSTHGHPGRAALVPTHPPGNGPTVANRGGKDPMNREKPGLRWGVAHHGMSTGTEHAP